MVWYVQGAVKSFVDLALRNMIMIGKKLLIRLYFAIYLAQPVSMINLAAIPYIMKSLML